LDSFRSRFKSARDQESDRESNRNQFDHQPHDPISNFEERENLCRDLD
jgi:hypothetical protein